MEAPGPHKRQRSWNSEDDADDDDDDEGGDEGSRASESSDLIDLTSDPPAHVPVAHVYTIHFQVQISIVEFDDDEFEGCEGFEAVQEEKARIRGENDVQVTDTGAEVHRDMDKANESARKMFVQLVERYCGEVYEKMRTAAGEDGGWDDDVLEDQGADVQGDGHGCLTYSLEIEEGMDIGGRTGYQGIISSKVTRRTLV